MADFLPIPKPPVSPTQPPPTLPPRPISPPASVPVKETDMSHLTPSPSPFKASIRTMEQDMGKTAPATMSKPAPAFTIPPPATPIRPNISVPPPTSSGGSKKFVWIAVVSLVIIAGIIAFVLSGGDPKEKPTPTPTITIAPTATPTPVPLTFEQLFTPGTPQTYDALVAQTKLKIPADLLSTVDASQMYLLFFPKLDGTQGQGLAVLALDTAQISQKLSAWEPTMPKDLKNFLKINTARSASKTFLSNAYQNIDVRYRNFPDAWNTVDYALVPMPNGDTYLFITNTRDHMLTVIDRVGGVVLGK